VDAAPALLCRRAERAVIGEVHRVTVVLRSSYRLTAWPWELMPWVRGPEGLDFTLYDVLQLAGHGVTVDGTPEEAARWKAAHDTLLGELRQAEHELRWAHGVRNRTGLMSDNRVLRLRRYDLLPGRAARSRRLFARCETRMRAAEDRYRPVREVVEARLADAEGRAREDG
jgi:hypothetical protein